MCDGSTCRLNVNSVTQVYSVSLPAFILYATNLQILFQIGKIKNSFLANIAIKPIGYYPVGLFFCSNVACRNIQALNMAFRLSHWLNSCCISCCIALKMTYFFFKFRFSFCINRLSNWFTIFVMSDCYTLS